MYRTSTRLFFTQDCKTFKSLREQYEIIDQLDDKPRYSCNKSNGSLKEEQKRKEFCFKCGSAEHKIDDCKSPTKFFKCEENGHMARDCPFVTSNVRKVFDESRNKVISVNGVDIEILDRTCRLHQ